MLEIAQGIFIVLFSSSIGITALVGFTLSYVAFRPFSLALHRRVVSEIASYAYQLTSFITLYSSKMRMKLHADQVPRDKSSLVIMNHSSRTDWLISLAYLSIGSPFPGNVKCVAKKSISSIPIFGWGLKLAEFVFLAQKWDVDKDRFKKELTSLCDYKDQTGIPLVIVLFPEGTLSESDKILVSQDYARKNRLPIFDNVLLPRFRGFREMIPIIRQKVDCIVDTTLIFDPVMPSIYDVLVGKATATVHFQTRVYEMNNIPESEEDIDKWLLDRWIEKENLVKASKTSNVESIFTDPGVEFEPPHVMAKLTVFFSFFVLGYLILVCFARRFKNGVLELFLGDIVVALMALGAVIYNLVPRKAKRKVKAAYGATGNETENTSEADV